MSDNGMNRRQLLGRGAVRTERRRSAAALRPPSPGRGADAAFLMPRQCDEAGQVSMFIGTRGSSPHAECEQSPG